LDVWWQKEIRLILTRRLNAICTELICLFLTVDERATKAASHDLAGLMAYYNTFTPGLYYPLMALIDYRGYRLIAQSLLPVDKTTIKYGSCDGGHTVHSSIPELNEKMKQAAMQLNLKGHHVFSNLIYGAGDTEGHLGKDGKFYVLDFARCFPPEAPSQ